MTNTLDLQIELLTALKEGKAIQFKSKSLGWADPSNYWLGEAKAGRPEWYLQNGTEWRIKPEPRVIWVNEYPAGSLAAHSLEDVAKCGAADSNTVLRVAVKYQEVL